MLLGDSITYSNPFGQWARNGAGKTAADNTICTWMNVSNWPGGGNNSPSGWYLAAFDARSGGSYTARSGITSGQYLAGTYGLPSMDQMFTTGFNNPDGKQYRDALMAVILLGTNDVSQGLSTTTLNANMTSIIDKLEADKIIPVLTTLPPKSGADATVASYNTTIRTLAQTRRIPLIDFWAEVTRRRPGPTWLGTLIDSADGVHPTASGGAYNSSSDPYASSGVALSNVGYLLRGWLTVQKIAEVKSKVLDKRMGDVNGDGHCDMSDLLLMAGTWGLSKGAPSYDQRCDLNGDNTVDVVDLLILADTFGTF